MQYNNNKKGNLLIEKEYKSLHKSLFIEITQTLEEPWYEI